MTKRDLHKQDEDARTTQRDVPAARTSEKTWSPADEPTDSSDSTESDLPDRYQDLGRLGGGGMGEVRRVFDRVLGRTAAMKLLSTQLKDARAIALFTDEARATARLQHPAIVPLYDCGVLPDGRPWFTMKEITGVTLGVRIAEVHEASTTERWAPAASGWTPHQLAAALQTVAEALAYAHSAGVLHRDVKPDNVMVGDFGEVLLVDWGLVQERGRAQRGVAGTPAYMSPEQARGEPVDERSDVYALGAMLWHMITGQSPHAGLDAQEILARRVLGEFPELPPDIPPTPRELLTLCRRAMAADPAERLPTAAAFAEALSSWRDGAIRRQRADPIVVAAEAQERAAEALRGRAEALRATAAEALSQLQSWSPEERKSPLWQLEDEAERLDEQAAAADAAVEQQLLAALTHDPDHKQAHMLLAKRYQRDHADAEQRGDAVAAARAEAALRARLPALPSRVRDGYTGWLQGDGWLTLHTDPPGVEVVAARFVRRNRRLVTQPVGSLGRTPLERVPLPSGSYLLTLRAEGRDEVRYPVSITRRDHWDGAPPGAHEPLPVRLPVAGSLGDDVCLVPPGWFWSGGGTGLGSLPRRRLWADAFLVQRFPVTNRQYIAFLDALVAAGQEEEAMRKAPRIQGADPRDPTAQVYHRTPDGGFCLGRDADGDEWLPDYPIVMIDHAAALAYADWWSERTGTRWGLPPERLWEKAARGVDGRLYPWGNHCDPTWACLVGSAPGPRHPDVVASFPIDESVYGVRGLGGNVADRCADLWDPAGPPLDGERVPFAWSAPELDPSLRTAERGG